MDNTELATKSTDFRDGYMKGYHQALRDIINNCKAHMGKTTGIYRSILDEMQAITNRDSAN